MKHGMDERGRHWITPDGAPPPTDGEQLKVPYDQPAFATYDGRTYMAVTDYYYDTRPGPKAGTVYRLVEVRQDL